MIGYFKKLCFSLLVNSCFFLLLIIGIQNSKEKSKLDFIFFETINLPISFIIGTSFICGSFLGLVLPIDQISKKN